MVRRGLRAFYQGRRVAYDVQASNNPGNGGLRAADEEGWDGDFVRSFNVALNELAIGNRTAHVAVYLNPGEYGELDDFLMVGVGENEVRVLNHGYEKMGVIVTEEGVTWAPVVGADYEWILPANFTDKAQD